MQQADLPFPVTDSQQLVDAFVSKATDRTTIALVSHLTSGSANYVSKYVAPFLLAEKWLMM